MAMSWDYWGGEGLNHTKTITGKHFMQITMEDYGLHPSPHKDAIIIK